MAAKKMNNKPQMGMGEQAALKPKFLKGIFTKDDGSMSTFGNVANAVGPLAGLVGIGKSIADLFRGGTPAMHSKKPLQARRQGTLARMKKRQEDFIKFQSRYSAEQMRDIYGKRLDKYRKKSGLKFDKKAFEADQMGRDLVSMYKKSAHKSKPAGYVSAAQRKAVWASKKDGGKGNPNRKKKR